jgi:5'-deoxynucleotidase YfbR-like HD superfamily hydrolase
MKNTIEFMQLGSEVTRYHTVSTLMKETVGQHSHGVAMLCLILNPHVGVEVITAALLHDLSEHVTGDIPSPAKRIYGIGDQISDLEHALVAASGLVMPTLNLAQKRLLKLADLAQGALFCARELSMGNSNMLKVLDRYLSYAEAMNLVGRERELFNTIEGMSK